MKNLNSQIWGDIVYLYRILARKHVFKHGKLTVMGPWPQGVERLLTRLTYASAVVKYTVRQEDELNALLLLLLLLLLNKFVTRAKSHRNDFESEAQIISRQVKMHLDF